MRFFILMASSLALLETGFATRRMLVNTNSSRRASSEWDSDPEEESERQSFLTGLSGFLRPNRRGSDETGADLFIRAFKLGMRAANEQLPSKDGKRVKDSGAKGQRSIMIKQWAHVNTALANVRDSVIPKGYGEGLIDNAFAEKIRDKYGKSVTKTNSKSGSIIMVSAYDERTRSRYLLKSEKRKDFIDGVLPIYEKYAERFVATDPCSESVLMKVLLVFEPLDIDPLVNDKVWMLIQNVNPFPSRKGNIVKEYDLKHSREVDRCKSTDPKEGLLGDFLKEFGSPLRDAVAQKHPLLDSAEADKMAEMSTDIHIKKTCLMNSISKDLSVLDSAYPSVKLVDHSVLMFAIRPKDDEPTEAEMEIVNGRNNVFKIKAGTETWFLVYSLIDLFATKNSKKWWQSHTSSKNYIFGTTKFSLYPFYTFCLSQFMVYYSKFSRNENNTIASASWEHEIGMGWPNCYNKGGILDKRHGVDKNGAVHGKQDTLAIHEAIRHDDRMCSLMQTCDAVLHTKTVADNLFSCCKVANDGRPCEF